jgi:type IV secretory pathway VirB9-like protein
MHPIACLAALLSFVLTGIAPVANAVGGTVPTKPGVAPSSSKSAPTKGKIATATRDPVKPQPVPYEPRLVVFPYTADYIYPILTKVDTFTHIQLAESEKITGFYIAEKLRWHYRIAQTGRDIFIKPVMPDNETTATLITDRRRYQLSLHVGPEDDKSVWYQRVSWDGEDGSTESELAGAGSGSGNDTNRYILRPSFLGGMPVMPGLAASPGGMPGMTQDGCGDVTVQVSKLNFNYEIKGDAPFRPSMVFDDGRFTWFKFPKMQDLPPIFAIHAATGEARIESFIACRGHHVVQALMPGGALLKLGREEVRIINKNSESCGGLFERDCKPINNIVGQ